MIKKVLAIDPSGSFEEGKGTTGWVRATIEDGTITVDRLGSVKAENYESRTAYFNVVKNLLLTQKPDLVVIEDYRLYNHAGAKASMQSYSLMETPRLLGVLENYASVVGVPVVFQMAHQMRPWSEERLLLLGALERKNNRYYIDEKITNEHVRCALKHLYIWHNSEREEN